MLTLPIKKKWFDMILYSGKCEEYRTLTPYYETRFKNIGLLDENGDITGNHAFVVFRNGYGRDKPEIMCDVTLKIDTGYLLWGAEEGEQYYVLEIHGFVRKAQMSKDSEHDG